MVDMATSVFPVGSIMLKGIMGCTVAASFSASLQLTNNYIAPVSNIADTVNPWLWIGLYKRPCWVSMLLNYGYSTFPAYLVTASYVNFPAPSPSLCLDYLASPFYYWTLASSKVLACCAKAYMVHVDNI